MGGGGRFNVVLGVVVGAGIYGVLVFVSVA